MIVDRITEYMGGERAPLATSASALAAQLIVKSMQRNIGNAPSGKDGPRRPSPSSGYYCGRKLVYDARSDIPAEKLRARARIIFTLGDAVEAIGVAMARQSGVPIVTPDEHTGEQLFVEATHTDHDGNTHTIKGSIDMTIAVGDEERPIDWKSISDWGFKAIKNDEAKWRIKERFGYIAQLRLYMFAMRQMGYKVSMGYIVAVNKMTGALAEVQIPWALGEETIILRRLSSANQHIDAGTIPSRPEWATGLIKVKNSVELPEGGRGKCEEIATGTHHEGWRCSYCKFTKNCFPGFSVVPLSKPVYRRSLTATDSAE